jgi:hypothetical protein
LQPRGLFQSRRFSGPGCRRSLLRAVAGFLITNYTRQHIITMPRGLRKRNVYEEVARLLDIPGGEQIVKESHSTALDAPSLAMPYMQMRKFNCWNISIVQQYSRFKESRIRSAVFGSSRQFFLMRQNDRADLRGGGRDRRRLVEGRETWAVLLDLAASPN